MKTRSILVVAMAASAVCSSQAMALIQYNDGGTYDITTTSNDDVWVDWQKPAMGTTVNVQNGGAVTSPYKMQAFEDSVVNVYGGSISNYLAYGSSRLSISDGSAGYLDTYDSSQVLLTGGSAGSIDAYDNSQITLAGGSLTGELWAFDYSAVDVSMGHLMTIVLYDSSQMLFTGGSVQYHILVSGGQASVSGGTIIGDFHVSGGQATWSGGLVGGNLAAAGNGVLTIEGSSFAVDGTPIGYGSLYSMLGGGWTNEPHRQLTRTLLNGDPIDSNFFIGQNASIVLVPEPATLALLAIGGIALVRRKRHTST
ncbi:hypothetical protein LCGC14_2281230 [marine sediment metagenome]|uniref:Ice-binding protein C-terminal domain-containing protein n=1 Tax=marine sediment metagenome TaxID=412755 RepID=A0A0F9F6K8_9ZZZZ